MPSPHFGTMSGLAGGRASSGAAAAAAAAAPLLALAATGPGPRPAGSALGPTAAPPLLARPLALAGGAAGQLTLLPLGPTAPRSANSSTPELPTRVRLAAGSPGGGGPSGCAAALLPGPGPARMAGLHCLLATRGRLTSVSQRCRDIQRPPCFAVLEP